MIHDKWYNGIGKSKNDLNGFDEMNFVDKDTILGDLTCKIGLVLESNTPNEPCIAVDVPSGDVYFLSRSSGKIWKRAIADGTYSLANTNANGAHLGGRFYNGKLYYATAGQLGDRKSVV